MMKFLLSLYLTMSFGLAFSQYTDKVGINTDKPVATLDVEGNLIVRTVDDVPNATNSGVIPLFRNPDGIIASPQFADRYQSVDYLKVTPNSSATLLSWNTSNTTNNNAKVLIQTNTYTIAQPYEMVVLHANYPVPTCINPNTSAVSSACTSSASPRVFEHDVIYEITLPDGTVSTFSDNVSQPNMKPLTAVTGNLRFYDASNLNYTYYVKNVTAGNLVVKVYSQSRSLANSADTASWTTYMNPARIILEPLLKL